LTSEPAEQKPGTAESDVQWRFARTRQLFLAMVHLGVRSKRMSEAVEGLWERYKSYLPDSFWSALVYTPPTGEYDFPRPRASEAETRITLDVSHLEEEERFSATSMTGSLGFVGFDLDRFHLAFSAWKRHILQCREALDLASLEVDAAYGTQHGLPSVQIREVIDRMQASLPYDPEMQDGVLPPSEILREERIKQACGPLGEWTNRLRSMAHMKQPGEAHGIRPSSPEESKPVESDSRPVTKTTPEQLIHQSEDRATDSMPRAVPISPKASRLPDWLRRLEITPNEWELIDILGKPRRSDRLQMNRFNPDRGPNHANSVRKGLRRLADCDPPLVDYPRPKGRGRHPGVKLTPKGVEAYELFRQRWTQANIPTG
jgi:hypothetical protein